VRGPRSARYRHRRSLVMRIFHIEKLGNLGNQMIQFLVAKKLKSLVPGLQISNAVLPEWGIHYPDVVEKGRIFDWDDWQLVPFLAFKEFFEREATDCIRYTGYGQRVENFEDWRQATKYFQASESGLVGFPDDCIVINIRGGEILDGRHPGYVLVPIDFYIWLVAHTGLAPVFMGQIADNPYCNALRQAFPLAEFIPSRGALHDFETLRRSVNVVPAISTFSWLACWLSESARSIFMPMTGLLNPLQSREHDFTPTDDSRFRFFWFPANYASEVRHFHLDHAPLFGRHREIASPELKKMKSSPCLRPQRLEDYAPHFDEAFYLARYEDIRYALTVGLPNAYWHYMGPGFREGRHGFRCDSNWYVRAYPDAAADIGLGLYQDPMHHFVMAGVGQGYRPTPPE
jgi:hypothetical protein